MIQLANDPNASRNFKAAANDGKGTARDGRQEKSGHAWPFLSRYAARPAPHQNQKPAANDSGS